MWIEINMYILVIRPGAIGDTLLTLPVLQALRDEYDSVHVTLVGNRAVLPLALASGIVDEVYDYEEARWSHLFLTTYSNRIRDEKMNVLIKRTQLAICWLSDPDGVVAKNLRLAGIEQVIVAPGQPEVSNFKSVHITTYLAQTISPALQKSRPGTFLSLLSIAGTITRSKNSPFTRQVALHPGSGGRHKCWPVERFAEVILRLWQRDMVVLVLAGPAEEECLSRLSTLLQTNMRPEYCEFLVNAPLLTIAQRLQQCHCYIGNDSGLTHLAALLGLPTLALFGPSDPDIWHPLGRSVTVLRQPNLEQLSVETVMATLTPLLR